MKPLLTVEQLAQYIHKSVNSIRSDACRNPQSLPPICRLPNTKRLLWRIEDVVALPYHSGHSRWHDDAWREKRWHETEDLSLTNSSAKRYG